MQNLFFSEKYQVHTIRNCRTFLLKHFGIPHTLCSLIFDIDIECSQITSIGIDYKNFSAEPRNNNLYFVVHNGHIIPPKVG